jgi:hypothetical protein
MAAMRYAMFSKAVAVFTLLSLVVQPRVLVILPVIETGGIGNLFVLMLLAVLGLAIAAIAGLWLGRWWGFLAFYGYGVSVTLLLGTALIPFLIDLAPDSLRVAAVVALNTVTLVFVASLQWRYSKSA